MMMYEHEFVFWTDWHSDGRVTLTTGLSLGEMHREFSERGLMERFDAYLSIEEIVWSRLKAELEAIDADDQTYESDDHYPAEWYRERAKYRAEEEAKKTVAQWRQEELLEIGGGDLCEKPILI